MSDDVVLCYHAATAAWPDELSVDPEVIARQVRLLLDRGYEAVRFADLARPGAGRRVAVTFDDAYRSVPEQALPALSAVGAVGSVYVPTDWASRPDPMTWPGIDHVSPGPYADELRCATWEQLGELREAGWEVGSHTCSHPRLTACDDEELERELVVSRETIASRLGACATIAYPYGDCDDRVTAAAARAGYTLGAALPARWHRAEPMAWPRVGVYRQDDDRRYRVKVSPVVRRLRLAVRR